MKKINSDFISESRKSKNNTNVGHAICYRDVHDWLYSIGDFQPILIVSVQFSYLFVPISLLFSASLFSHCSVYLIKCSCLLLFMFIHLLFRDENVPFYPWLSTFFRMHIPTCYDKTISMNAVDIGNRDINQQVSFIFWIKYDDHKTLFD